MAGRCRARDERPRLRRVRLNSDRDPDVLHALGRMKFLRTHDLRRLAFGSREGCARRMAKLFAAGLVHCHVPALNGPNVYSLSEQGKRLLVDRGEAEPSELRTARSLGRTNMEHLVALTAFRLSIALACKNTPGITLGCFRAEWDLKVGGPPERGQYVPDAMFTLESENGPEVCFAVEVDLGGEAPRYVAERKVRPILAAGAGGTVYGFSRPRLIILGRGDRRLVNVARAVRERGGDTVALIGDLRRVNERNVLGAAFATPRDLVLQDERGEPLRFPRRLLEGVPTR